MSGNQLQCGGLWCAGAKSQEGIARDDSASASSRRTEAEASRGGQGPACCWDIVDSARNWGVAVPQGRIAYPQSMRHFHRHRRRQPSTDVAQHPHGRCPSTENCKRRHRGSFVPCGQPQRRGHRGLRATRLLGPLLVVGPQRPAPAPWLHWACTECTCGTGIPSQYNKAIRHYLKKNEQ